MLIYTVHLNWRVNGLFFDFDLIETEQETKNRVKKEMERERDGN